MELRKSHNIVEIVAARKSGLQIIVCIALAIMASKNVVSVSPSKNILIGN